MNAEKNRTWVRDLDHRFRNTLSKVRQIIRRLKNEKLGLEWARATLTGFCGRTHTHRLPALHLQGDASTQILQHCRKWVESLHMSTFLKNTTVACVCDARGVENLLCVGTWKDFQGCVRLTDTCVVRSPPWKRGGPVSSERQFEDQTPRVTCPEDMRMWWRSRRASCKRQGSSSTITTLRRWIQQQQQLFLSFFFSPTKEEVLNSGWCTSANCHSFSNSDALWGVLELSIHGQFLFAEKVCKKK